MSIVRFYKTVGMVTLAILATTACSDTTASLRDEQWVSTERGDVYCLMNTASHGFQFLECDWATLTNLGEHTTEVSLTAKGIWQETERGKVYCLESKLPYDKFAYDCDWETLTQGE